MKDDWQVITRLIPGYDPWATAGDCWFDEESAQAACDFFPECLRHVEGALKGQPFALEPWQKAIVGNLFGWKRKDEFGRTVRRYREALILVGRKNGKALALDTDIPTPSGWAKMGDLRRGDSLFNERGEVCRIVEAHPVMVGNPCFRVAFSDGTDIVADSEHLWKVHDRRRHRKVVLTTGHLARTFRVGQGATHRERRYGIPTALPLTLPERKLPIEPYTLGVWLGDGDADSARLTAGIDDIEELLGYLKAVGTCATTRRRDPRSKAVRVLLGATGRGQPDSLQSRLRASGLLRNKHIPPSYLRASEVQRHALLQGLMDTDGYVSKSGQQEFCTVSMRLYQDTLELIRSLGWKPTVKIDRARIGNKECGPRYRIQFWSFGNRPAVRMARKVKRLKPWPDGTARSMSRQVVAVDPIESVPVRCIAVDSPSQLFLAGRSMIPTHNTPLVAGIGIYCLFCDDEAGQQNFIAAASGDQAGLMFRHVKGMIEQEQELAGRCRVYGGNASEGQSQSVVLSGELSFLKVIAGDKGVGRHGKNPHFVSIDEVHELRGREIVDAFRTAMVSINRPQPLLLFSTTSDFEREGSVCNQIVDYARLVRDGITPNVKFLPVLYEALPTDDWKDPATWRKANPNLGVSVSQESLADECQRAQEVPALENEFKRLHLNIRTEQSVRWLPMDRWDACTEATDPIAWRAAALERFKGCMAWAALDIGSTSDLTALALLFPDGEKYILIPFFWVPRESARRREERDRVPYVQWIRDGFILPTEGVYAEVTDFATVVRDIVGICGTYPFVPSEESGEPEVAIDPLFKGNQVATLLAREGVEVVAFGQGFMSMAAPTKALLELVICGRIDHGANSVLRWMAGNVTVETDAAGNMKPSKGKSAEKIDGIVAAIMAVGRAGGTEVPEPSYYDTHELEVFG